MVYFKNEYMLLSDLKFPLIKGLAKYSLKNMSCLILNNYY